MTESLYLLLAISVVFVIGVGAVFWWAIFSGQFDDASQAGESVLFDDDSTHECEPEPDNKASEAGPPGAGHSGKAQD